MLRIGDLLVQQGMLTADQRDEIVTHQQTRARPFGVLAEELFGLAPESLDRAWAAQLAYYAPRVNPTAEAVDTTVQALVNRRQAWQFKVLPLRRGPDGVLLATAQRHLPRALRYVNRSIAEDCALVLCDEHLLLDALEKFYPMPGAREHAMAQHAPTNLATTW